MPTSPAATPPIAVYGATGFTGGLICRELLRRELPFTIGGRDPEKLSALAEELAGRGYRPRQVAASIQHPRALDELIDGARVLINAAGPFVDVGINVVEAAVRKGVHYLDTTGEQAFMYRVERTLGSRAEAAGVALAPACAFEFATGDCVAAIAAEKGARELVIAYATSGAATSRGTKKSILRAITNRGLAYREGELVEQPAASASFEVPLGGGKIRPGLSIPGGEALTVPLHSPQVTRVDDAMVVGKGTARMARAGAFALPALLSLVEAPLDALIDRTSPDPHASSDGLGRFTVVAFEPGGTIRVAATGSRPYDLTARLIAEAAARLNDEAPRRVGFTSPAGLFDAREFLSSVGVQIDEG